MTHSEHVNCPICESADAVQVRFAADIVKCRGCGVVYLRTRPKVEELERWYSTYHSNPGSHMALPKTKEEVKSSGLRRDYLLNEVLELVNGDERGLLTDVGAGWGAFLDNARDKGFQVRGNEICEGMAHFARTTLDIKVWSLQLENCPFGDSSSSVVTALHSLEHLPNQSSALNCIGRILKPGGLFCGIVPNFGSFMSMSQKDNWYWLDANFHYVQFCPETLESTLRSFGFEPVRIYTRTDDFDPKLINAEIDRQKINTTIAQLEQEGRGEALRFFARKQ